MGKMSDSTLFFFSRSMSEQVAIQFIAFALYKSTELPLKKGSLLPLSTIINRFILILI